MYQGKKWPLRPQDDGDATATATVRLQPYQRSSQASDQCFVHRQVAEQSSAN